MYYFFDLGVQIDRKLQGETLSGNKKLRLWLFLGGVATSIIIILITPSISISNGISLGNLSLIRRDQIIKATMNKPNIKSKTLKILFIKLTNIIYCLKSSSSN